MTDMRATERLLEVLGEHLESLVSMMGAIPEELAYAQGIVAELRRRGDTLVRAEDLRIALRPEYPPGGPIEDARRAAIDRIENALGGKML